MFDTSESIEEQPQDKHRQRHRGNQANRFVAVFLLSPRWMEAIKIPSTLIT